MNTDWRKSKGHIAFVYSEIARQTYEMYQDAAGSIWRAPITAVFDGDYRIGRWECDSNLSAYVLSQIEQGHYGDRVPV